MRHQDNSGNAIECSIGQVFKVYPTKTRAQLRNPDTLGRYRGCVTAPAEDPQAGRGQYLR